MFSARIQHSHLVMWICFRCLFSCIYLFCFALKRLHKLIWSPDCWSVDRENIVLVCLSYFSVLYFSCADPGNGCKEAAGNTGGFTPEDQGVTECCWVGAQHPQTPARQQWSTPHTEHPLHTHHQRLALTHTTLSTCTEKCKVVFVW